ncbi:hypothetical protein COCVIDRAFT_19769 [Bipolaris victoriae FI3]|uniref:Uncharacterized protein n=1 Tax=Bipolaris victoriae (strain FI3) TaxID=930091 RepID=W7E602_BIPV3|nr:hypothetical protein COCVIDRAFT_19769 [Bipolaris victoriae FI3]
MRSYVAVSIFAFSASVFSAPTPQLGLNNLVGTATGTVGSLTSTVGKTVDPVTGVVSDDAGLKGVTGILNEKRQLEVVNGLTRPVTDLTKPVTDIVGDATKIRVVGNARRQLNIAPVAGLTKTVDGVTNSVNLNGAVNGLNTNVNSKRQLNVAPVAGLTKAVDGITDSVNLSDATNGQVLDTGKLLDLDLNLKRGVPVVQDLPVGGAVSSILDETPVVSGVTGTLNSVTGDLNPVTESVYKVAKPVTDATEILDVRAPLVDEVKNIVGDVDVPLVKDVPVVKDI